MANCPFCGAAPLKASCEWATCGSFKVGKKWYRTQECYDREQTREPKLELEEVAR